MFFLIFSLQRTRSDLTLQFEANTRLKVTAATVATVTTCPPSLPPSLGRVGGTGEETGSDERERETSTSEEQVTLIATEVSRRRMPQVTAQDESEGAAV